MDDDRDIEVDDEIPWEEADRIEQELLDQWELEREQEEGDE